MHCNVWCEKSQTSRLVGWKQTAVEENSFEEMMEESSDLLSSLASERQTLIPIICCSTF